MPHIGYGHASCRIEKIIVAEFRRNEHIGTRTAGISGHRSPCTRADRNLAYLLPAAAVLYNLGAEDFLYVSQEFMQLHRFGKFTQDPRTRAGVARRGITE